ncbi:MAG TPA: peptide MFS transporter, partial [Longimicrobiaceae bacterium]
EMWERFSYYGMRAVLILFLTESVAQGGMGLSDGTANALYGAYVGLVYLAALPGGWIADRLIGARRSVLYGGIIIALGHYVMAIPANAGIYPGLLLIVVGTGLLKPNVSTMVGELYPEGGARRDAGFSIFYMGINLGAFAGQLITGFLGEKVGWHLGFGAAGVGMFFGLMWFALRSRATLGDIGTAPARHPDPVVQSRQERTVKLVAGGIVGLVALLFVLGITGVFIPDAQLIGRYMAYVLVGLALAFFAFVFAFGGLDGAEKRRVAVIVVLFLFAAIFWSAFEQAPTSLNLFAKDFTHRQIGSFEVPATWFQSINSAFIILLAPFFAALWVGLGRRRGDLSSPAKFALGLFFAGIGFALMIPAANAVVNSNGALKVSAMWLVGSYFFQTVGELCLSPVGLSSMTKLSPRKYVGQMMGIWFLASAVGNLIGGLVGGHVDPEKLEVMPGLFTSTTAGLFGAAAILALLVIPIRKMMADVRHDGAHGAH